MIKNYTKLYERKTEKIISFADFKINLQGIVDDYVV